MALRVTLTPSGRSFEVREGESVLAAGLAAGCNLPYSCRQGMCGTCHGTIVAGRVHYGESRPEYLTREQEAAGIALLCRAMPLADLTVEVWELSLERPRASEMACRVKRIRKVAHDVAVVSLRLPMQQNFKFVAGQYIEFLLEGGKRRNYSIAVPPSLKGVMDIELHIRHLPGGLFTDRLFSRLSEGEMLRLHGPLGSFYLREDHPGPAIFVAGSTGFAPIKSVIEHALGQRSTRPMRLYWGGRSKRDLYLPDLPYEWEAAFPDFTYVPVLAEPLTDDGWSGRTGLVHRAVMDDFPDLSGHQVYACGSPGMVDAARRDFGALRGLPQDRFFADSFLTEADRK